MPCNCQEASANDWNDPPVAALNLIAIDCLADMEADGNRSEIVRRAVQEYLHEVQKRMELPETAE